MREIHQSGGLDPPVAASSSGAQRVLDCLLGTLVIALDPIAAPKTTKYSEVEITGEMMLCISVRRVRAISNL